MVADGAAWRVPMSCCWHAASGMAAGASAPRRPGSRTERRGGARGRSECRFGGCEVRRLAGFQESAETGFTDLGLQRDRWMRMGGTRPRGAGFAQAAKVFAQLPQAVRAPVADEHLQARRGIAQAADRKALQCGRPCRQQTFDGRESRKHAAHVRMVVEHPTQGRLHLRELLWRGFRAAGPRRSCAARGRRPTAHPASQRSPWMREPVAQATHAGQGRRDRWHRCPVR